MQNRKHNRKSGFTLIELLVVIAIIGTLASVVLVQLNEARAKSRDALRISQLDQVKKAMELYFHDNGEYPPHGGNNDSCGSNTCLTDADELVTGGYFATIPVDPITGNRQGGYRYMRTGSADGYVLMVRFETDTHNNFCRYVVGDGTNTWATISSYRDIETDPTCQP